MKAQRIKDNQWHYQRLFIFLIIDIPVSYTHLNLCKEVKSVPTAYDVDAVVDKLKQRSKEYNSGVRLHGKPEEMITTEAIEIVKSGGGGVDAIRSVGN